MSSARIELAGEGDSRRDAGAALHEWPLAAGHTDTIRAGIDWHATQFGLPAREAKDLLRVVAAAYIADRTARQPAKALTRPLTLTVHVDQPDSWTDTALEQAVDLLHWLTGDDWALRCVPSKARQPELSLNLKVAAADDICLVSGGLDSLCGALIRLREPGTPFFLGHADTSTLIRRAQEHLQMHLAAQTPPRTYTQYPLRHRGDVGNRTPKTRSLLFMTMAVVAASGMGARRVLVPENGFTSINPPLEPSRAGVMTTRSTHPWTFHALAELLATLGLTGITVENPHHDLTKGQLLKRAMPAATAADQALAAATVSCAKPNPGRPPGGNPNTQCGVCIACLVRRAAFIAAGMPDLTDYAVQTWAKANTVQLSLHRCSLVACLVRDGRSRRRIADCRIWCRWVC
ncbi:7-cyano-7-deazaguanine synthase [Jatrophihabitans cynanchi]|uniref:7-cyano-7-deazaguanine synthase n=1 Tax=Jatrophihabitans cynanchi TaxID=2944128 RepID=A0ABY7JUV4_9ACTN|nr:7-cyano-7-deazaguanine synthase [Jatrophihabitans sp. SB3-54]WAX55132.1 7-cyano-7-deazaguanine synthase [Jatrophihabitans sp. SB3-54]